MLWFDYWKSRSAKMPDTLDLRLPGAAGSLLLDALPKLADPPTPDFTETDRQNTLAVVFSAYAMPLHRFLMAYSFTHPMPDPFGEEEAADVVLDFLGDLNDYKKEAGGIKILVRFDRSQARLRTYLKECLAGHYGHIRKGKIAQKRGGGMKRLDELSTADGKPRLYPPLPPSSDPEEQLELGELRNFILDVIANARRGGPREFRMYDTAETIDMPVFRAWLDALEAEPARPSLTDAARATGRREDEIRAMLPRFRQRLKQVAFDQFYLRRNVMADESDPDPFAPPPGGWSKDNEAALADLLKRRPWETDRLWKRMLRALGLDGGQE